MYTIQVYFTSKPSILQTGLVRVKDPVPTQQQHDIYKKKKKKKDNLDVANVTLVKLIDPQLLD